MALTTAQKSALKAFVEADSALNAMRLDGNYDGMAEGLNAVASPAWTVWRTVVTRAEIYHRVSLEGTSWNWTTYKNQSVAEQNAWVQMFMGDEADFSLPNLRSGISAIFAGSAQANAQRDHVLATGKRSATVYEKVLSTGAGSVATPATLGTDAFGAYVEGRPSVSELVNLWR